MKVKEKVKILKRYVCQLLHPLFSKLFKKQKQRTRVSPVPSPLLPWTLGNTKSTTTCDLQRTGKAISKYELLN